MEVGRWELFVDSAWRDGFVDKSAVDPLTRSTLPLQSLVTLCNVSLYSLLAGPLMIIACLLITSSE